MKFLVGAVLFLSTILSVDALKCYSSVFSGVQANKTDFSKETSFDCGGQNNPTAYCKKDTLYNYNAIYSVTRGCEVQPLIGENGQPIAMGQCANRTTTSGMTLSCVCNTDLCNSSSPINISIVVVFGIAAWILFKAE